MKIYAKQKFGILKGGEVEIVLLKVDDKTMPTELELRGLSIEQMLYRSCL